MRFLGGVEVGRDLSLAELRNLYDAVLLGTGAPSDAPLGAKASPSPKSGARGASPIGTTPAPARSAPRRSAPRVALVGHGNVAIDAARVLLRPTTSFAGSDLWLGASETLAASPVREVALYGRRGAAEAKFTTPELRELLRLEGVRPSVEGAGVAEWDELLASLAQEHFPTPAEFRRVKGNLEALIECRDLSNASNAGDSDGTNGPNNAEAGAGRGGKKSASASSSAAPPPPSHRARPVLSLPSTWRSAPKTRRAHGAAPDTRQKSPPTSRCSASATAASP